ncbi:hypothetical protein ABZ128_34710 [Streptomyces sp. NPDC006326]|uniref:hypothetical protein n=1 Tax=Streptomyces sp. NPDC006326 TaxID=3156752 RepID=UPI0033BB1FEB
MSDNEAVKAVPDGCTSVTPWIIGNDTAGLIDHLERAFGAEDLGRFVMEDGARRMTDPGFTRAMTYVSGSLYDPERSEPKTAPG